MKTNETPPADQPEYSTPPRSRARFVLALAGVVVARAAGLLDWWMRIEWLRDFPWPL